MSTDSPSLFCIMNLEEKDQRVEPFAKVAMKKHLDSADTEWAGPGNESPDQVEPEDPNSYQRVDSYLLYEVIAPSSGD